MLFFFFEAFQNRNSITIIPKPNEQNANQLAALLPKKSDSGTQVIFDDSVILPIEQVLNQPTTQEERIEEPQEPKAVEKEAVEKKPRKVIEDVPKEVHSHLVEHSIPVEEKKIEEMKKEEKKAEVKQKIEIPKDLAKLALANLVRAEKTTTKKPKEESLATCYVDHEKGNSCLIRHGANRFPGLEEMKYICYEKQIEDHIISTWKSRYGGSPAESAGKVSLTFLITKNGSVEGLSLLESSGNKSFDAKVLDCIRTTIFPPVPNHFGVEKYRPRGGYTLLPSY